MVGKSQPLPEPLVGPGAGNSPRLELSGGGKVPTAAAPSLKVNLAPNAYVFSNSNEVPESNDASANGVHESDDGSSARSINYKGFSSGELKVHHQKHGNEFDNISQPQYLNLAKAFIKETGDGIQEKIVGNFYVKYDNVSSRLLVAKTNAREIRTFYKADSRSATPFEDAVKLARELSKPN